MKTMNVNDEEFVIFEEWADGIIEDSVAVEDSLTVLCQLCSFEGEEVCVDEVDYYFDNENVEMDVLAEEAIEAYEEHALTKVQLTQKAWKEVLDGKSNIVSGIL